MHFVVSIDRRRAMPRGAQCAPLVELSQSRTRTAPCRATTTPSFAVKGQAARRNALFPPPRHKARRKKLGVSRSGVCTPCRVTPFSASSCFTASQSVWPSKRSPDHSREHGTRIFGIYGKYHYHICVSQNSGGGAVGIFLAKIGALTDAIGGAQQKGAHKSRNCSQVAIRDGVKGKWSAMIHELSF